MGAIATKYEADTNKNEISVGEIQYPNDPRSPTPDISRTPLEGQDAVANRITKNVDLTKECFEKYCNNMPTNPAFRNVLNEIDPRSPTLDFKRTPLAVLIKNPELMAIYNRMNASDFLNTTDLDASKNDAGAALAPKNLEEDLQNLSLSRSEQISNEAVQPLTIKISDNAIANLENDESKGPIIGLLETNLDYFETDLDTVERERRQSRCSRKNVREIPVDSQTPSSEVEMTPEPKTEAKIPIYAEPKIEIKEIFDHNVSLQKKMTETPKALNADALLIYEDNPADENKTPILRMNVNVQKNMTPRTPLASVMNVENSNSNNLSNPTDSKKLKSKIPIKVKSGHSPRFLAVRNSLTPKKAFIKKNRKMAIEAVENTPPKVRNARWDQDNSVIL